MQPSTPKGKTVYLDDENKVGIWLDKSGKRIKINVRNEKYKFISSVSNDPRSERGNPHLFNHLAKCLRAAGAPHPEIPDNGR